MILDQDINLHFSDKVKYVRFIYIYFLWGFLEEHNLNFF